MTERIVLDGLPMQVQSAGIGVYTAALVRHLAALRPEWEFVLYGVGAPLTRLLRRGAAAPSGAAGAALPPNVTWHHSALFPLVMGYPLPAVPRAVPLRIPGRAPALFHATNYAAPRHGAAPVVVTVHDLALVRFPELGTPALRRLVRRSAQVVREAHLVIADSQATAADLRALFGVDSARTRVVYPGCDPQFRPLPPDDAARVVAERLGIRGPYVLHVGTLEPRKNLERLVTAFLRLHDAGATPHTLVCAGAPGWGAAALHRHLAAHGADARVRLLGRVPDDLLPALYAAADVFAYPSLYEGFGLPVLEAMACGTPVVTADVASLPEVAGDAALYVDPRDADALTAALDRALRDHALRAALRARGLRRAAGFTWTRCARETLAIYDHVRA
jgi:glycosyltransferase involved in cell wall biosynthesis